MLCGETQLAVLEGGRLVIPLRRESPPSSSSSLPYNTPWLPGSSSFFNGKDWDLDRLGIRDALVDVDESMAASSPGMSSAFGRPTSPEVSFRAQHEDPRDYFPPWGSLSPQLSRVDSIGLSHIGSMNIRDQSTSPTPGLGSALEPVGEEEREGFPMDEIDTTLLMSGMGFGPSSAEGPMVPELESLVREVASNPALAVTMISELKLLMCGMASTPSSAVATEEGFMISEQEPLVRGMASNPSSAVAMEGEDLIISEQGSLVCEAASSPSSAVVMEEDPMILDQDYSNYPFNLASSAPDMSFPPPSTSSHLIRVNTYPIFDTKHPFPGILRRTSMKRSRDHRRASQRRTMLCDCPLPDRTRPGQKLFLLHLPLEIIVKIFQDAIQWPPTKLPQCQHQNPNPRPIFRRFTTGDIHPRPRVPSYGEPSSEVSSAASASSSQTVPPGDAEEPPKKSEEERKFGIKTLIRLGHTCTKFSEILLNDQKFTDETFWMVAARRCWEWLPEKLEAVQGTEQASQTSWRNLVAVFMRSENSQFGTQKGSGKGGVDCFGGKKPCNLALSWDTEKARRREINRDGRRKVLLACAQPGPDYFTVTPDENSNTWTISLSLQYGQEFQVHLDEYGRFGEPGILPSGLKRGDRPGYFAPGIFEDVRDKSRLVKFQVRKGSQAPLFATRSHGMAVQEVVRWDLRSIPEFVADDKAHAARCASHGGTLLCSLFTHRNPAAIDDLLDPPEDARLFCLEAGVKLPSTMDEHTSGMSSKRRGKLPANRRHGKAPAGSNMSGEEGTVLRWRREFEYRDPNVLHRAVQGATGLHPVICNIQINETNAVVLVRWNEITRDTPRCLFDREFHVLDLRTGETVKLLVFPNLYWDYRHHDMDVKYNVMRVKKLNGLYNPKQNQSMGPGNRTTRIHHDAFCVTSKHIISGSHDYCNWIWPLDRPTPPEGRYTESHNDGGLIEEPFDVLDDFYWNSNAPVQAKRQWEPKNERAGWWVKTPNQVLCFWHGIAMSHDESAFAVCRPGKMFVWNLNSENEVRGYTCLTPDGGDRQRWLGKPRKEVEETVLEGWGLCEDVVPEQGLWLLYDDNEAVFINRDEILEACGLEKAEWGFQREEFGFEIEKVETVDGEFAIATDCESESESGEEDEEDMVEAKGKRRKLSCGLGRDEAVGSIWYP